MARKSHGNSLAGAVDKLIALRRKRADLEAKLEKVKEDDKALAARLVDMFANAGVQSIKQKDGPTVFVARSLYPKILGPRADVVAALLAEGVGDLVKTKTDFNTNSLGAWVREYVEENKTDDMSIPEMPGRLKELVGVSEVYDIRIHGL